MSSASNKKVIVTLFIVLIILVIGFVAFGVLALTRDKELQTDQVQSLIEKNQLNEGISISGVDVSGMDEGEARIAIDSVVKNWYQDKDIAFTVSKKGFFFNISEMGVAPDVDNAIKEAFLYSAKNILPEGMENETTVDKSMNFEIVPNVSLESIILFLQSEEIVNQVNITPDDAGVIFRPKSLDEESRFEFQPPLPGIEVNVDKFAPMILNAIQNEDYSVMEAPYDEVLAFANIEDMKENTQLIGSYTSKITINGAARTANVVQLAKLMNEGMPVVNPGETLSLNGTAGARTEKNGFQEAPGLTSGVHDLQYGGGVCQISSTMYVAALKAELEISERHHHSLPSEYIPIGLDATISETPDLQITNNNTSPIYVSVVVNEKAKTVTCNIYGPPAAHGYEVDVTSKVVKTTIPSPPKYKYGEVTPGGSSIKPGELKEYIEHTYGQRVKVYRLYKDSEGNVVKSEYLYYDIYDAFTGEYYLNPNAPS
jgi:vancomycin resistance protein YoaR